MESEIQGESLRLGERSDIAQIPGQPTSENSGKINVWLQGFAQGFSFVVVMLTFHRRMITFYGTINVGEGLLLCKAEVTSAF